MSAAENKTIVCRVIEEVWNQGNFDIADELIAENYVYQNPAIEMEVKGPQGYKHFVLTLRNAYADLQLVVDDVIAEGNKVVTSWTFTGKFQDITKPSKPTNITGVTISRIKNGKVVSDRSLHDALGLLKQLGVISV